MWGGRFSEKPSSLMQEINQSITFDNKLYKQDIAGSIAHATMLESVKILTKNEAKKIIDGLKKIEKEIEMLAEIIDELCLDVCFEVHREQVLGMIPTESDLFSWENVKEFIF